MDKQQLIGLVLTICFLASPLPATASGIVDEVVKAPISPDGNVVGAITDLLVNLDMDMDPSAPGKMLRSGESIRIELPDAFKFVDNKNFPIRTLFSAKDCRPGLLRCSTGVLLHGWPQHPILPSFPPGKKQQYTFTYEALTNTIVYTAIIDIKGVPLPGPGIKQIHLLLLGFKNPDQAGRYPIRVGFFDAAGREMESGVGNIEILANIAPSINMVSVFVPGDKNGGKPPNPNIIYQKTAVGKVAPMPWDFLMWNAKGKPFTGIEIMQNSDHGGDLRHGGKVVGHFNISVPHGATGQKVSGGPSVKIPATPVIGKTFGAPIPTGRLTAIFVAGSKPGRYFTTFQLHGGNSATMVVDVVAGSGG